MAEAEDALKDIKDILKTADIACLIRMQKYTEASLELINIEIRKRITQARIKKISFSSADDEPDSLQGNL